MTREVVFIAYCLIWFFVLALFLVKPYCRKSGYAVAAAVMLTSIWPVLLMAATLLAIQKAMEDDPQ